MIIKFVRNARVARREARGDILWTSAIFWDVLVNLNPIHSTKYVCVKHGDPRVFQFEIIINVLVSSFRFI